MKVMRKDGIMEKNHAEYMKAERDILTIIDHPFVVMLRYSFQNLAEVTLFLGNFLFIKVVVEDFRNGISGFWSLNLIERVTREKIGSGLVIISMALQLLISNSPQISVVKH
ncbi:hypothetical protein L484_002905 [Morus notabilis]|uniref:Protein kinase domain-containing protein n=1 Tax=Morus notabilis TaxID=981085 RepID=W9QIM0_9ROSA|nr:hypothetical protein L484_002905 [Morus notabilis]